MPVAGIQPNKSDLDLTGMQKSAILMVMLGDQTSGEILKHLTEDEVQLVTREVARLRSIGSDVAESVLEEFRVRAVAEMFNRLDSDTSKEILGSIERERLEPVETIRHLMFVFEDILLIHPNALKEVLSRVDRKALSMALKGTGEQLKTHFLQCMSQRGAEMLREDMEAMGPVKIKDVEAAQQQVIAIIRQLEAEGVLSIRGTVGEQYVV